MKVCKQSVLSNPLGASVAKMSSEEPTKPYVYQPFGAATHRKRADVGRLWGVGGVGGSDNFLVTISGLTKMEAEAVRAALSCEPNQAIALLAQCYKVGHREGWEDGATSAEVMEKVNDYMCNHFGNEWARSFTL